MTGKQRLLSVITGGKADRIPWVPFAGVHAGKLLGFSAGEVSADAEKLFSALMEVNRLYKPDGQPVMFDLQIEAEVLGCSLLWPEAGPPTVASHPLAQSTEVPSRIPGPEEGRISLELEVMKRMKDAVGESTALYGLCCGPFTLASHLKGTDLFMDLVLSPEYVHSLIAYSAEVSSSVASYLLDAGADVIAVVDPMISQISPDHFTQFMEDPYSGIFAGIRKKGGVSAFFVCGNADKQIEPMCRTSPDSISVDENVSMEKAKHITDRFGISLGGNIPLTSVMLHGNQQDNMKYAVDLIDSLTSEGLIISPGCDMPFDTPIENVIALQQAVHEPETVREMISNYQKEEIPFTGSIPDYSSLPRPLVEVFTLDSATCAACTYMLAAAEDARSHLKGEIDVVEYKFTEAENIARCRVMGVAQLPSIYINGELAYSSIIPSRQELIKKLEEALDR